MLRSTDRILTTHSGALPGPSAVKNMVDAKHGGDASANVTDDAAITEGILESIQAQIDLGIDVKSDGEFWKQWFLNQNHYDRYTGITSRPTKPGEPTWAGSEAPEAQNPEFAKFFEFVRAHGLFDVNALPMPEWVFGIGIGEKFVANGPVGYTDAGREAFKAEVERSRAAAESKGIDPTEMFFPIVGPGWFSHFVANEYYDSDQEYLFALADTLNEEAKIVTDAGFILQLDDPALVDHYSMINPTPSIADYREMQEIRVEASNRALAGIPEERARLHVCWGSPHWPHMIDIPFKDIVDLMLKINVQAYDLESASVTHELDYQVWETVKLPEGKIIIPGVVSHMTSGRVEPAELVAHRIVQYAEVVGRENVIAGIDCGPGGRCHDDIAWAKLKAIVAGAELASKKLFS